MTSPCRGFRPHGLLAAAILPAAMLPAAILSLSLIGPAAADEVAYLMYAPGNKGKTEPIRILWDELDQANARITIDVGEQFEPWLKRIGLGRVLKYDAKANKQQFVVRDPQLTELREDRHQRHRAGDRAGERAARRAGAAGGSRRERRNAADHAGAGPRPHDDRADRAAACRLPGAAKIRTAQARGPDQQRSDLRGRAGADGARRRGTRDREGVRRPHSGG